MLSHCLLLCAILCSSSASDTFSHLIYEIMFSLFHHLPENIFLAYLGSLVKLGYHDTFKYTIHFQTNIFFDTGEKYENILTKGESL
jgi:hypothetical protein